MKTLYIKMPSIKKRLVADAKCKVTQCLHKSHNTPLLPPPPPKKKKTFCVGIVFDFSWDIFMSQEKLQTMVMQTFWGVIEVYCGIVQVVNTGKGKDRSTHPTQTIIQAPTEKQFAFRQSIWGQMNLCFP